jgi:outer membrane receptor protein involved in Fe transport
MRTSIRSTLAAFVLFLASLATSALSAAQPSGTIAGTISDPTGAAVASATVELVAAGSPARSTTADAQGRYRFDAVEAGDYVVRVSAASFQRFEQAVRLTPAAASAVVDARLTIAGVAEAVQVVAAAGYERSARDLPVSATVIGRQEALASPERSVDALLRNVASVQLQNYDADTVHPMVPSLAMRGVGIGDSADRGLVLVDGLPINGGFFGHVNFNRAPKRTIERVEVVRGASSSLFGSFAMGGVVDIITRVPSKRETAIDLQYGQNDRVQANLYHGGTAGARTAYSVNANVTDSDGFYTVLEEERRPIDTRLASNLFNVQGRLDTAPNDRLRLFVKTAYDDQGRDGPYVNASTDSDVFDLAGGLAANLDSAGALDVRVMYSREHFDVRNVRIVDDTTTFVANPHLSDADNLLMSAQWARPLSGSFAHVTAGADLRRIDGRDDQQVFNTPGVESARIIGEGVQTSIGVFGQVSVRPTAGTEILAGARLDRFDNADGRITNNGAVESFADRSLTIPSFRVAGRVQATPAVGVRGAVFKGFTAPTLANLYRSFESPTFRGLSNPDLVEERLLGGDGGVEIHHGPVTAQINYFYTRVEDFLGSAEVGFVDGKFTVQLANVAAIRSRGLETMAEVRVSPVFTLNGNYTFTDSVVVEGELTGNDVEGAPRHTFGIAGSYVSPVATLTIKARFVDDTYQDITNEAPQDAHFIVDFLVAKPIGRHVEVFATGENIFDDKYVADGFGGSLGPPRQIGAGIRVTF